MQGRERRRESEGDRVSVSVSIAIAIAREREIVKADREGAWSFDLRRQIAKVFDRLMELRSERDRSRSSGVFDRLMELEVSIFDSTLRRWRKGQPIESWEAHKAAIQAVIKLFSGELVTGVVNSNTMRHGNLVV